MHRIYLVAVLVLVAIVSAAWVTDFITLQGEWTVYTATCEGAAWRDGACAARAVAGPRYRFRALKAHREVLFWTAGETGESGRFTQCNIQDGRNWSCPPNGDASKTITHRMVAGRPQPDPAFPMLDYQRVPKWKWELLSFRSPAEAKAAN